MKQFCPFFNSYVMKIYMIIQKNYSIKNMKEILISMDKNKGIFVKILEK